jgi:hypothetical protein
MWMRYRNPDAATAVTAVTADATARDATTNDANGDQLEQVGAAADVAAAMAALWQPLPGARKTPPDA